MKLPGRMLDLSSPLDNETVFDPPFMRPKIEYRTNAENAPMLLDNFPGLRLEDLPDGEGWAFEIVQLSTHNGTHMDAPVHYQSKSIDGRLMMTIDQVPLDWFVSPNERTKIIVASGPNVGLWQILLQKSFCTGRLKFCGP